MNSKPGKVFKHGALALVLVIGLVAGAISTAAATEATTVPNVPADLKRNMSLTLGVSSVNFFSKLPEGTESLVYDMYKIADAVDNGAGIEFNFDTANYSTLAEDFNKVIRTKEMSDYMVFAQKALAYLYGESGSEVTLRDDLPGIKKQYIGTKVPVGQPGMYLIVVRGSDNYKTVLKEHKIDSANVNEACDDASEGLTTCVDFGDFTVTASPQLISIPENDALDTSVGGENDWIYDVGHSVKISVEDMLGSIKINKELFGYNPGSENATFVFSVVAKKDGKTVHDEVYSAQFTKEGKESIVVTGLPVGAEVTVEEIYSGAAYNASVKGGQVITVKRDTVEEVNFTNTYDDWQGGGGGIINHFTYAGNGSWTLTNPTGNQNTQNGRPIK